MCVTFTYPLALFIGVFGSGEGSKIMTRFRLWAVTQLTTYCDWSRQPQPSWSSPIYLRKLFWLRPCSAADISKLDRFLNRCRKLYRCRQLNQDISELFSLAVFVSAKEQSTRPPLPSTV